MSTPEGAEVIITQALGFRAEWDGKGTFEMGPLGEGTYRTLITPASGRVIRGKTFDVVGKKSCKFTFDDAKQEWSGTCS
jgi:hypothetical protein